MNKGEMFNIVGILAIFAVLLNGLRVSGSDIGKGREILVQRINNEGFDIVKADISGGKYIETVSFRELDSFINQAKTLDIETLYLFEGLLNSYLTFKHERVYYEFTFHYEYIARGIQ